MDEICFRLSDYHELLALHRVVLKGKFSLAPHHDEVRGSPYVASVANKILDTLILMERSQGRENNARAWEMRRQMAPDLYPDYWGAALKDVEDSPAWRGWSEGEKKDYAALLLSPFIVSDEVLARFVEEADKMTET